VNNVQPNCVCHKETPHLPARIPPRRYIKAMQTSALQLPRTAILPTHGKARPRHSALTK